MNRWRFFGSMAGLVVLLAASSAAPLAAEGEKKIGWSDRAEFSYVLTAGNSETQTLGFKNKLLRHWEKEDFELNAGGVRAESTKIESIYAVGSANDFSVNESKVTEKTAENYYLNGKYSRTITERFFWYAGAGWDRNTFAGVENRYTAGGGVGNTWIDEERIQFRTDYGLTYTDQKDVVPDPNVDDKFAGFRFAWSYQHKFGATTTYGNDLTLDENLNETKDLRADMTNSVAVGINSRLALKVSLEWQYDNLPSLEEIPLYIPPNAPPAAADGTVLRELDDLDTIFTTSLVVSF